ncbi:chloramphenicol acetyltransferase [Clostridium botulinum]|nr:chloramphenicol acetyltransferase [Clostridium botulinum]
MNNTFNHWTEIKYLKDSIKNPLIEVVEYTYYSGYYAGGDFEDVCVRYIWGDQKSKEMYNPIEDYGWTLDKIKIGKYCCFASGVVFMMGGNPAKHIKERFDKEKIDILLKIKWWDWEEDHIKKCIDILSSSDIDKLYKYNEMNIK